MSADRARWRRAVAVLVATVALAVLTPAPTRALSPLCAAIGVATPPFGDVICEAISSAKGPVSKAISFAEDPLGYLQQHLTAGSDAVLAGLIDQTGKS